jgi:MOSC domain-containing protein YiiM
MIRLLSINIGMPREVSWEGRRVSTGIWKTPVPGPVTVRRLNLEGDGQADLTVHGGEDKAVYAYSHDTYETWKTELKRAELPFGAMGENLTFTTLDERSFCLGDVLTLGGCELEVVQPRFPCYKLGILYGDQRVLKTFMRLGRPGIYFRVVKEGSVREGDVLTSKLRDPRGVSMMLTWDLKMNAASVTNEMLKRALLIPTLNEQIRAKVEHTLEARGP